MISIKNKTCGSNSQTFNLFQIELTHIVVHYCHFANRLEVTNHEYVNLSSWNDHHSALSDPTARKIVVL